MFEHRFVPPFLPPDNDRVCDHNALLAFPQEKFSHYTTEYHANVSLRLRRSKRVFLQLQFEA